MSEPLAFVLGWPVEHARSPVIHRHWLARFGIAGDYRRAAVPPDELAEFLRSFSEIGFVGGNVTVPHKEAAFRACGRFTDVAKQIEAVNTLWLEGDLLCGDNSDAYGFAANLDERAPHWRRCRTALVIGSGGSARAVIQALIDAGYEDIAAANRTLERAERLAGHFGPPVRAAPLAAVAGLLRDAGLVVNTTSAGMAGSAPLAIDWASARADAVVADIVYIPLLTPFLAGAAARGLRTVDGLGMLLHQAAPGFERWFGRRPTVDAALRAAVLADLAS